MKDQIFGFEIIPKLFNLEQKRPKPPVGFVKFNYHRVGPEKGNCPNCGHERLGSSFTSRGFQDRDIQNLKRAMDRLKRKKGRGSYELFCIDVDPSQPDLMMLKCHPSR